MGNWKPLHRVVIGRSRELRGPDAMEMGVVMAIIALLMLLGACFGRRLLPMVQSLDALSLASGPAYNEVVYHAVHGRWPSPNDPAIIADNSKGMHVSAIALGSDGVITAQLTVNQAQASDAAPSAADANAVRGALSFRPQLLGSRDAPTITFLCGYARPIVGQPATVGANLTTLRKQDLPPFCR